jgi:hypothetical protein
MKERKIVFGLLLISTLAYGIKSSLDNPNDWFKGFFFGLVDALVVVGVLNLIWNWVAKRRTIHSRGFIRRIVFGLLLAWALFDAVISVLEAHALEAPGWIGIIVFFFSLGWSLIFIVLLYLIWNWIAGLRKENAG